MSLVLSFVLSLSKGLVIFTVPGVILGGQLGPWVDSRFPQRALERGLHILLLLVATLTLGEAVL